MARGEAHGYALLQTLTEVGFGSVKGGTLYPLLSRQQDLGRIDHRWETGSPGPARKVFHLTDQGRQELDRLRHEWRQLNTAVMTAVSHQIEEKK